MGGVRDKLNATKVFIFHIFICEGDVLVVYSVVSHPQPFHSEQKNAAQWLRSVRLSETIRHNNVLLCFSLTS